MAYAVLTQPDALARAGLIDRQVAAALEPVVDRYPLAITPSLAKTMADYPGAEGLRRQFVPDLAELNQSPAERHDPIDDAGHSPLHNVVHRYRDRVLLKVIEACPVYCRFCFRREMVGQGGPGLAGTALDAAVDYIASQSAVQEVILSGGDPFMLSPRRAAELTRRLAAIKHVDLLRWHTRVPMVDPDRVTDEFVAGLSARGATTWAAIHANHPAEFTTEAIAAIGRLTDAGIGLVSQSVLLAGVNDDLATLADLMRCFLRHRIKPYYLHHPDLAPGTGHFRVSIEKGQELMAALRKEVSGLAQPTYVLDVPDGSFKAPLSKSYVRRDGSDVLVKDGDSRWHRLHNEQEGANES